ncbi:hypothetical protein SAMD00019534_032260 [Acytostelium subglobosum LB1]|uniref:hypothetical protein n=1 Tax=Acytostelium subglobosum LB1 TaxID=1410327 RepID=UPI000644BBC4|nr:hypothetical protein SAMD00019534_032260 [Acytostelium subglobosum LB1]GAM20051.1 hypothetical protein SAMD00019534_032260 [Acytostelium subglobosum LB1]|eukprot:XP_012756813.1 hypothetical protein SAMD00019534_032260 [Acytostelium subglobosum LB1]
MTEDTPMVEQVAAQSATPPTPPKPSLSLTPNKASPSSSKLNLKNMTALNIGTGVRGAAATTTVSSGSGSSGSSNNNESSGNLLNYFSKVQTSSSSSSEATPSTPTKPPWRSQPTRAAAAAANEAISRKRKMDEEFDDDVVIDEQDDEDYVDKDDDFDFDDEVVSTPSKSRGKSAAAPSTPKKSASKATSSASTPTRKTPAQTKKEKNEERYGWLEDVKDANQLPVGHPDYDARTLHIPQQALAKLSAFERQYWEIKSMCYDTVVFFKKGKFYELYEGDADIGHEKFGLKMTDRVNMRMVGVPESSFPGWASKFILAGYKVSRVDQVESRISMDKRQNQFGAASAKDSIIKRELTSIMTIGTLVDEAFLPDTSYNYLMAIKEDEYKREFGVCFVDTSIGLFNLCTFVDDENQSQLETLLLQTMPREVLIEKGGVSPQTVATIKKVLHNQKYLLASRCVTDYWDAELTLATLKDHRKEMADPMPEPLPSVQDKLIMMCAMGAIFAYLEETKLAKQIIGQSRFTLYNPMSDASSLILDGQCLINLEVFNNTTDGSKEGSLFRVLNRCSTAFGQRMLKQWVCRPLCNRDLINARLDTVQYLGENNEVFTKLMAIFTRIPDLERMISRIQARHSKLPDLVLVLDTLERCQKSLEEIDCVDEIGSKLLRDYATVGIGFPNLKPLLGKMRDSFTYERSTDTLTPSLGLSPEYDKCKEKITEIELKLENYLLEQKKFFSSTSVCYKNIGKEHYQIEVPVAALQRVKLPTTYSLKSEQKGAKRYYTPFIEKQTKELSEYQDELIGLSKEVIVRIQESFNENASVWCQAVNTLAHIDCLLSLAKVSLLSTMPMCRPEIVGNSANAYLEVQEMRHPAITIQGGSDFIPNDLVLGKRPDAAKTNPCTMVLTGPNMGGKSTLLRQACILVIMAQMGCYVPATMCRMSLVDRIFTRLGANDNILAGQSTFMIELQETSNVLRYATQRSLVIMDELGRGTSTFDGYSIAYSVLNQITNHIKCLCMFATHYQSLANEPKVSDAISKCYMSCHVDELAKKVIFLYKLCEGVCPSSYGMLVGGMAGIPVEVVHRAEEKAKQFERESTISSYIHGTTSTMDAAKKIVQCCKSKDYAKLVELWKNIDLK